MFSQTWKKYFPVIAILMKRAAQEGQTLSMNEMDFKTALGGRKAKTNFSICMSNGRLQMSTTQSPIAKEFAQLLQEHDQLERLLLGQVYEFSLNGSFQLTIKNITTAESES